MKRKEILQHCIDILYEQLIMQQIDMKAVEEWYRRSKSDTAVYEFQELSAKTTRGIEILTMKIEIAQKMLKEMDGEKQ